ncbi:UNVERIFIED_CONTAM: hypothetical protein FKN15_018600 [Acipenser sinensis]
MLGRQNHRRALLRCRGLVDETLRMEGSSLSKPEAAFDSCRSSKGSDDTATASRGEDITAEVAEWRFCTRATQCRQSFNTVLIPDHINNTDYIL